MSLGASFSGAALKKFKKFLKNPMSGTIKRIAPLAAMNRPAK